MAETTRDIPLLNPYYDLHAALQSLPAATALALRKKLIWAYSWAVPSAEAIGVLASHAPLVEVGAGTGYWAWLVKQHGAKIIAYDENASQPPRWTEVEHGDARAIARHEGSNLFLCWPSYESPMAFEALTHFKGERVIYVGELGGRTADHKFHDELVTTFSLEKEIAIPCWPGFNDKLYVFKRR